MRLILASQSPARRHMLEAAGVRFETASPGVDEAALKDKLGGDRHSAAVIAGGLADAKALAVEAGAGTLVIAADQILECKDGVMFDKPRSREDAARQLRALSGNTHILHAAASVAEAGRLIWRQAEMARITMRSLSDSLIRSYLEHEYSSVRNSVGAYHIETRGAQLVERIDGSYFAILGMPLLPLLGLLRDRGVLTS